MTLQSLRQTTYSQDDLLSRVVAASPAGIADRHEGMGGTCTVWLPLGWVEEADDGT